jgi:hypothetical protein
MNRKKNSQNNQQKKTKRQGNPIPWRYCVLTLFCGLLLITGFFFAARQHFSSIDYSIKNSRLRRQLDELEADKRRLVLAKEIALSPAEIKKVAKKIGFTETTDKIAAAAPASVNSAVKPTAERVKQAISNKIEAIKKAVEAPAKEPVKTDKPQNTKDKSDKSLAQFATR